MHKLKRLSISVFCLLLTSECLYAQQDSVYTLKKCIEIAIGNNLSLQQKG